MVLGCHAGDCHYRNGNIKAMKRMKLLKKMMAQFGIDPERLMLDWVSAGESERFQKAANSMAEKIYKLGPLKLKGYVEEEAAL